MSRRGDTRVDELRREAEGLLRRARPRVELFPVLERLVAVAPEGSDHALFAHRHLAEFWVEENPWRALLHLRRIVRERRDDDVVHALMGLCHALLGNFRVAVGHYRRALSSSPRNPWYHHNVGHLLDVALATPAQALPHLRSAHRLEPLEDEITASLAHCLAGMGTLAEARGLAADAVRAAPRNREHRALLSWVERGAPVGEGPHATPAPAVQRRSPSLPSKRSRFVDLGEVEPASLDPASLDPARARPGSTRTPTPRSTRAHASSSAPSPQSPRRPAGTGRSRSATPGAAQGSAGAPAAAPPGALSSHPRFVGVAPDVPEVGPPQVGDRISWHTVDALLERKMSESGCPARQRMLARTMWRDFYAIYQPRVGKPGVHAAAVEYALRALQSERGVTQSAIARRYEVSATALGQRYSLLLDVLALHHADPRYVR